MYNFILNQWILRAYNETNIANCVTKGYITQDQANTILATQQITETTTA
jgi:hypothetical protein